MRDERPAEGGGPGGPVWWATAVAVGAFVGLSLFTFVYGEGDSYLRDDPRQCVNCHVMQGHFDAWVVSSHRSVATCNDCHVAQGFVHKWISKADNGFFHTLAFTTGVFPETILIKPRNRRITQAACLQCHAGFVHAVSAAPETGETLLCVGCHASVGHARR